MGEQQLELAEQVVYDMLQSHGLPTEEISDTGTVEQRVDNGVPLEKIAAGKVSWADVERSVVWL